MSSQPVFIPVGDLADGFAPDSHILPGTAVLQGRKFVLHFADGSSASLQVGEQECQLTSLGQGSAEGFVGQGAYRASSLRPGIVLLDFIPRQAHGHSLSLVLDLSAALFTAVAGQLPSAQEVAQSAFSRVNQGQELTAVRCQFAHGSLDQPLAANTPLHHVTDELLGLRNLYRYSPTECYEHIYLNSHFYTWQCLQGVEQGLADVDRCHYFKLDHELYLFVWREKIIPTLGVVLIDLQQLKTDGKIFGYQGNDFSAIANFPVGARTQILNRTSHPLHD
ncbi:MoaF C-terminal domain-containing protein [Aquitalea magnusonii]|uniref:Molybdenum cofactor biosynthesis protein F n=1 Tax=Aquitalea magnusonii TaxID=332411 RepID=A0A318JMV7_9NEIS|nr:MoaF C-terminal domain-containing protein [Aquitalea magnusonii]PXX49173.1 molybdenum cofactor biosynthesis protein F [Aquitalea magnusonii]